MRCMKCGYHSFDYLDACPKCGADWKEYKEKFHITAYKPEEFNLLSDLALSSSTQEEIETVALEEEIPQTETSSFPELETKATSEVSSSPEFAKEGLQEAEIKLKLPEGDNFESEPAEEISLQPKVLDELEEAEEALKEVEGLEELKGLEGLKGSELEEPKLEEPKSEELKEKRVDEKPVSEISEELEPLDILEGLSEADLDLEIPEEDLLLGDIEEHELSPKADE